MTNNLANLSDRYRHIDTMEVVQAVEAELHNIGINTGIKRNFLSQHREMVEIKLLNFGTEDYGGLTPSLKLFNSHDAKSRFKLLLGIDREVCSNKMTVSQDKFECSVIHIKGDATDHAIQQMPAAVARAVEYIKTELFPYYAKLQNTEISRGGMAEVVSKLNLSPALKGKALEAIYSPTVRPTYDQQNSLFSLYNFINQFVREAPRSTLASCEKVEETLLSDIVKYAEAA